MTPAQQAAAVALRDELEKKPPALKLYEIATAFELIDAALEASGGEWTEDIAAQMEGLEGALEWKAENICRLIQQHTRTSEAFKAERERLQAHEDSHRRSASNLKAYLFSQLERIGREKLDAGVFKVRVQKNSRPSIEWTGEPRLIPEPFRRTLHEVDGTAAYDAYRAGGLPEGFAVRLGKHLRVS